MRAWKYQIYSTSHVEHLNMTFVQYIDIYIVFLHYQAGWNMNWSQNVLTDYLLILVNALLSSIGVHSSWFHA